MGYTDVASNCWGMRCMQHLIPIRCIFVCQICLCKCQCDTSSSVRHLLIFCARKWQHTWRYHNRIIPFKEHFYTFWSVHTLGCLTPGVGVRHPLMCYSESHYGVSKARGTWRVSWWCCYTSLIPANNIFDTNLGVIYDTQDVRHPWDTPW